MYTRLISFTNVGRIMNYSKVKIKIFKNTEWYPGAYSDKASTEILGCSKSSVTKYLVLGFENFFHKNDSLEDNFMREIRKTYFRSVKTLNNNNKPLSYPFIRSPDPPTFIFMG